MSDPETATWRVNPLLITAAVALAYGLSAESAWRWLGVESFGMTFYPPAGITLAALVLVPRRRWWAVFVGAALAETTVNLLNGLGGPSSLGFAAANCIEAAVGASLLVAAPPIRSSTVRLDRRSHLWWFLGAAVVAGPFVGAVLGSLVSSASSGTGFTRSMVTWWSGDALGVLAIGAPLLVWHNVPTMGERGRELLAAVLAMVGGSIAVYSGLHAVPAMVILPVLVWAALRLGVREVAALTPVIAISANLSAATGSDIFQARFLHPVAVTQLWIAAIVLTGWFMAIGVADRLRADRRGLEARRRSEQLRVTAHAARLAGCSTEDDLRATIIDDGGELLGAVAGAVFEVDDGRLVARLVRGEGAPSADQWAPIPLDAPLPVAACARTGELCAVDDLPTAESVAPWFAVLAKQAGYQGLVAIPLRSSEGVCAVAAFAFTTPVPLTAAGELDLPTLRDRWSGALRRVQAQQRQQHALEQLARLQRLTAELAAAPDRTAIRRVVRHSAEVLGAQTCILRSGTAPETPAAEDRRTAAVELGPDGARAILEVTYCDEGTAIELRSLLSTAASLIDQALRRATVAEVEHTVALALQRSMLGTPDRIPDLAVGTVYEASQFGLEVGGDWYDVIDSAAGPVLVIGDVVGHGLRSAAAMGQLRIAVRTLAPEHPNPEDLLCRLDELAASLPGATCTTIAVVSIDLARHEARYACAGHLPPLLVPVGAEARFLLDGRGVPVAAVPGVERRSGRTEFAPGDQLVLYTDGLVERRDEDLDDGLERLRRTAGDLRSLPPEEQARQLVRRVRGRGDAEDDTAVLVAAHVATAADGCHAVGLVPAIDRPLMTLACNPAAPSAARTAVRGILRRWDLQALEEDASLVVSELISNVLAHCDCASLQLEIRPVGDGSIVIAVSDPDPTPLSVRAPEPGLIGGLGLAVVDEIADDWGVDTHQGGKTVWARLAPAHAAPGAGRPVS